MKRQIVLLLLAIASCRVAFADDLEKAERLFKARKWQQARDAYEVMLPKLSGNDAARVLRQIGYTWQITHHHEEAPKFGGPEA